MIATEFCAQCHIVTDPQTPPPTLGVPSFFDIANDSTTTALSLKAFFGTPHERMPDYIMHPSDIDDIIAYILNLRGRERSLPPTPPPIKPTPKPPQTTPTGAAF
ncbi:MAG: cytochrome c [Rhodospirillaceae bacterium]|nr:cytochrome c [Rhodospirillaceae bacterium]